VFSSWVPPKEISKLPRHEVQAFLSKPSQENRDDGGLHKGYEIALNPAAWLIKMGVVDATAEEQELELVGKAADGVGSKRVSVKRKSEAIEEDLNGKSSLRGGGYHMRKRTSGIAR